MKRFLFLPAVFFFTGCASVFGAAGDGAVFLYTDKPPEAREYQYSAPWDKEMYDTFYVRMKPPAQDVGSVRGGIVPHHLLAGHIDAAFFETIAKQRPSTIVLFGPNHFGRGFSDTITTGRDWKTVYGDVPTDRTIVAGLTEAGIAGIEEAIVKEEHSVYSLIPFIKKSLPEAKVVPLILSNRMSFEDADALADALLDIVPKDTVFVSSIDFSHYQRLPVANFHDALSIGVIRSFDYERLDELEIDSVPSLYMLMQVMERLQTQRIVHEEHENSASLVGALGTAETTSYYAPYFSDGPPSSERVASMFHVGDIMLDRSVKQQIDTHGESYLLEALAGREGRFFSGFDIGVANLEGPFADYRRETTKEIAFRFDPALIPMLEAFSFDVFNLANNHSLDMGRDGLEESKKHLRNAAMEYFGTQYGVGEESVLIKEIGGLRFGFVGFNDTNLPIRSKEAVELIESLEDRVDHTIVNIHWGQEYQVLASNARQQALAHAFVDAGADVVVGHHPHVVQEIEIYNDRPIFYSLGNFIFDQYWSAQTQVGFALGLVFHDTDRISVYVFPHHSKNSQVTLMEYRQAKELFVRTVDASRFGDYTIDNFSFTLNLAK